MTLEEERIAVEKIRNGDPGAFELLVIETQNDVYAVAFKMLGNPEDALDASQDAFIRAYTGISKFRGDAKFSVWMYRITYNICLDRLRKARRYQTVPIERGDDEPELQIPDTSALPEERIVSRETSELVRQGIETLSPKLRSVLVLREVSGLSYAEIASATGLREGTVKSRINRARGALSDFLRSHGTFPADERQNHSSETEGGGADA
ncbi:MAG: sigma-70 family RNA polymerase sigma factor [Clostridiales bacterium]|nr:sigma-70 family RNA polymerase sigma factor [Clostridiales bacterium]